LWFFDDDERLSRKAKDAMLDTGNENFVSTASIWELAIKISRQKYSFNGGISALVNTIEENGFVILETIKTDYLKILQNLPFHHNDPFDRLIVAAAVFEKMPIITADENIGLYDVKTLW
jgi:PIN domain nuclease of toxin-antitoxin system